MLTLDPQHKRVATIVLLVATVLIVLWLLLLGVDCSGGPQLDTNILMGNDLFQSRVTIAQCVSLVIAGALSLTIGTDVPNHEQLAHALYAAIGGVSALAYIGSLVWAVIGRMKADKPITSIAGVKVKSAE
jgi:hypothetical protein